MKKHILLAGSNLRKAKSQTTAIIVFMLLQSVMLNLWLMLSTDYKQNFDRCHDKLNAGHVTLSLSSDNEEIQKFLTETIEKDTRTDRFSLDPIMQMPGSFSYNGGEINAELVLLEKQAALTRSVEKIEIVEDSPFQSGIYLPVLYQSEDIATGKTITLSIGGNDISYTVCGFFNSVMAGSHNCTLCGILLTEDKYRELEQSGFAVRSTLCSVRLKDKADSESYETMLKNAVSTRYPAVRTVSNSYALVSQSRYISQMICSGILSAMAFFILLIALIVMASNIIN